MKRYLGVFDPEIHKGVYALSLVKQPAMKGQFLALSEQEQLLQFQTVDEDKQILVGLALQPNLWVSRTDEKGEPFEVSFTNETIEQLAHNFFVQHSQNNSTIEHQTKIDGITVVESWVVEDEKNDKQTHFGFSYPVGSWLVKMKIHDKEIWDQYVKTGAVLGFSIDALVDLKPVTNKNEINMKQEIVDAIVKGFADIKLSLFPAKPETPEVKSYEVTLGEITAGDLKIMFDGEALVVGEPVWTEIDGEKIPLPVGEYPGLEGDRKLIVAEEGIVGEILEGAGEVEKEVNEEMSSETSAASIIDGIKSLMVKFQEENNALRLSSEEKLEERFKVIEAKVLSFGEQAPQTPAKTLKYSEMSNIERMKYNKENR